MSNSSISVFSNAVNDFRLPDGNFHIGNEDLPAALDQFNQRWGTISIEGTICYVEIKTGKIYSRQHFLSLHEACRVGKTNASFIAAWLTWEGKRMFSDIGFYPDNKVPDNHYNTWRGFRVEPKEGAWDKLDHHIRHNICQDNDKHYTFLMDWFANIVQNPTKKTMVHVVLRGKEGVGKTKICDIIGRLLGRAAMVIHTKNLLTGRFNYHWNCLLFAEVREAMWAGDKEAEGILKALADEGRLTIEKKRVDAYDINNYVRLLFTSNERWVVPASSGGRRWFVLDVSDEHEKDYRYFAAIDEQMDAGGFEGFLHALLTRRITSNLRDAPVTEALIEQRIESMDRNTAWLHDVMMSGQIVHHDSYSQHATELQESEPTTIKSSALIASLAAAHANSKRKPTGAELMTWLNRELNLKKGPRQRQRDDVGGSVRQRTYQFPALIDLRRWWHAKVGEDLGTLAPVTDLRDHAPKAKSLDIDVDVRPDEDRVIDVDEEARKMRLFAGLLK